MFIKNNFMQSFYCLLILLLLSNCSYKVADFSISSSKDNYFPNKNYQIVKENYYNNKIISKIFVLFPVDLKGTYNKTLKDIVLEESFKYTPGYLMTDIKAEIRAYYIPFIYGKSWIEITGNVFKRKGDNINNIFSDNRKDDKILLCIFTEQVKNAILNKGIADL